MGNYYQRHNQWERNPPVKTDGVIQYLNDVEIHAFDTYDVEYVTLKQTVVRKDRQKNTDTKTDMYNEWCTEH